ncbi:MAG: hypothetical protein WAW80_00570 [Candidatus Saccharimonadales bacterium]
METSDKLKKQKRPVKLHNVRNQAKTKQELKDHSRDVAIFLYNLYRQRSILKEGQSNE